MSRQRVAAIIIKDHKILLAQDDKADHFCMPGGGIDEGEDHAEALARELEEELGVKLKTLAHYHSFDLMNVVYLVPQTDHTYRATIEGEPACATEIRALGWFSKDDITTGKVKVPVAFYENIFSKLVEENIL